MVHRKFETGESESRVLLVLILVPLLLLAPIEDIGGYDMTFMNFEVADTTPPVITHTQITTAIKGSPIPISAIITDDTGVASATLFYRIMGEEAWKSASMLLLGDNNYSATIPASNVTIAGVEYYITAMDVASNTAYKPETAPTVPYSITVITDWNPWDDDGAITTGEIQEAISYWLTDTPKNGHTLKTTEIQEMVALWLTT